MLILDCDFIPAAIDMNRRPTTCPCPSAPSASPSRSPTRPSPANLPVTYILTVDKGRTPEQDDFYPFYLRAKARSWSTVIMEGDHNVQRSHPQQLAKLIEQAP